MLSRWIAVVLYLPAFSLVWCSSRGSASDGMLFRIADVLDWRWCVSIAVAWTLFSLAVSTRIPEILLGFSASVAYLVWGSVFTVCLKEGSDVRKLSFVRIRTRAVKKVVHKQSLGAAAKGDAFGACHTVHAPTSSFR